MILSIILVIIIFSFLVFVHELGHFWAARRSGVEVQEFGFGFPPRLFGRRVGGTLYSVNLLPLGGFVRLKGESGEDRSSGSFASARYVNKFNILLAGVGMNILLAYVILTILAFTGLPPVVENQFSLGRPAYTQEPALLAASVSEGSPAQRAGIRQGDLIISAGSQRLSHEKQLFSYTQAHAGERVILKVKSGQQTKQVPVVLNPEEIGKTKGYLGVVPFLTYRQSFGFWAPVVALGLLGQLIWGTLSAFGGFLAGLLSGGGSDAAAQVTGPVGIVSLLSHVMELGVAYLWVFVASISVSLAVINALPLPALDGGRLAIVTAGRLSRRPLSAQKEAMIHTIGFVLLLILMAVVTYIDIKRIG